MNAPTHKETYEEIMDLVARCHRERCDHPGQFCDDAAIAILVRDEKARRDEAE